MSAARDVALLELDARPLPHWPAGVWARKPRSGRAPADARDRALADQLLRGTIKNVLLLQHLIGHYSGRPLRQIDVGVQKILALGLYQLRFLRIPPSAAVNEAVEQAKRFGRRRAAGLVNAVLRNALRQPDPPLPTPADAQAHASIVLSHPPALFERFVQLAGPQTALKLCAHDNREPPIIIRLMRQARADQLIDPAVADLRVRPHERAGMFIVENGRQSTFARWAREGIAQVQDPTAARVVERCDLHPGMRVLDRCAGLGTKTLQIWEHLAATSGEQSARAHAPPPAPGAEPDTASAPAGNAPAGGDTAPAGRDTEPAGGGTGPAGGGSARGDGLIIALDPHRGRMARLGRLLAQRGIENVRLHVAGMLAETPERSQPFDRALVDVPCSNSGVLPRRPEARYAQSAQALRSLIALQDRILDDTAPAIKPGGLLVYSTCSLWPEENRQRVEAFLARWPEYTLIEDDWTLPSLQADPQRYHDGGYYAVLKRRM